MKIPAMKIMVSGATGLVGTALVAHLTDGGHEVVRLVRQPAPDGMETYAPANGCDAVVHLAGENVATGRWTAAKKRRMRDSRVPLTGNLARALAELPHPPRVLISASALGYFGDRGATRLDEDSAPGTGFLAELVADWEAATEPAEAAGIRVVHLRIAVVLARGGGALAKMLLPFRLGTGGTLGDGSQWMSWIHLEDLLRMIAWLLEHDDIAGPVHASAPTPVTNREFTKTLGRVLRRPTILPVPRFVLRLVLGEMADEMLLTSTAMVPKRMVAAGFEYRFADLEVALRTLV